MGGSGHKRCGKHNLKRTSQTPICIRRAITKIEVAVVLAICGGLFALLYPAVQNARDPQGPHGEVYPTVPPAEDRRITHATGLSLIAPVNWDQIRDEGPTVPALTVACRGRPGARLRSWITVRDSEPPSESVLAGFMKTRFGDSPAFESMKIVPTNSDGGLSTYQLYVDYHGHCWHITFHVAEETTTLSPAIKQYIDTIRFPDGR